MPGADNSFTTGGQEASGDGMFPNPTLHVRLEQQMVWPLKPEQWLIYGEVAFSPDSQRLLAVAGGLKRGVDPAIHLWNLQEQRLVAEWAGLTDGEESDRTPCAFAPPLSTQQGVLLATGSAGGTVRLWDGEGHLLTELQSGEQQTNNLCFSANGRLLAASFRNGTVVVWAQPHTPTAPRNHWEQVGRLIGHYPAPIELAFSPDGQLLATGDFEGDVRLWDTGDWRLLTTIQAAHERAPRIPPDRKPDFDTAARSPRFDATARILAVSAFGNHGELHFWEVAQTNSVAASTSPTSSPTLQVRWLRSLLSDPALAPYPTTTLSPDQRLLVSSTESTVPPQKGHVVVVEMATRSVVRTLPIPEGDVVGKVAFSPDGQLLATAGEAGTLWIWEVASQQIVGSVVAYPDSWDWRRGAPLYALEAVAWSPDGQWIATSGLDPVHPRNSTRPPGPGRRRPYTGEVVSSVKLWRVQRTPIAPATSGAPEDSRP